MGDNKDEIPYRFVQRMAQLALMETPVDVELKFHHHCDGLVRQGAVLQELLRFDDIRLAQVPS